MSNQENSEDYEHKRRYMLILEYILEKAKKDKCFSLSELEKHLHEHGIDIGISKRNLQRDIQQIKDVFGVGLAYDTHKKKYCLNKESSVDPNQFLRLIEIVRTADLLTQSLREGKEALRYLSFDAEGSLLHGIENLKPILYAVKNRRKIAFTHCKYSAKEAKQFSIFPYLLKEYQNRWYVVGKIDDEEEYEEIKTFGIDRITNLEVKAEVFKRVEDPHPSTLFKHTIGLGYLCGDPQEVILLFDPVQGRYIKTLPLHSSQKVLQDDDAGVKVSLQVVINFELKQKILMHGNFVKVLGPEQLALDIREIWRLALQQYS